MIKNILTKYREQIAYLIFGVLTTVVNFVVYWVCTRTFGFEDLISNFIAWFLSVLFAFITNKLYVFNSKSFKPLFLIKEAFEFVISRAATGALDMGLFALLVSIIGLNDIASKVIIGVIITILNYIISKLFVFRKSKLQANN